MLHILEQIFETPWTAAWALPQTLFTIWMLVDCYQRGAEYFWFWVILFVPPIGPWVYFFAVKMRDFRLGRVRGVAAPAWQRRLSLDELRYRADRAPTVVNRLALAERLMDKREHREAIPLLEAILKMEPGYCPALHDLALCHLACGQPDQAVPALQRLIERDRRWSDYRAWHTLVDAYDALDQNLSALQTTRELAKMVPTLENICLEAERLIDAGQGREAADVLDRALTDHRYAPLGTRLRQWRWARRAQRLAVEAEAALPAK